MDALKHLAAHIPDWQKRLEDLNSQVAKRQRDLAQDAQAAKASSAGATTAPRSVRNKGSTESLRPQDEPEACPRDATPQPEAPKPVAEGELPSVNPADPPSPTAVAQTNQARAAGQARARAILRKRQRSDSIVSAEGAAPKFRTRSMIIVYYDSYVQLFFEDLVKFVSASRNMMRKAKMAAKVAQIKRLAELEMPDESDEEEAATATATPAGPSIASNGAIIPLEPAPLVAKADGAADSEPLPALRFTSTRRMQAGAASPGGLLMAQSAFGRSLYSRTARGPYGRGIGGGPNMEPDVYDDLDKGLEYVQSMCEHAAHQFLRDGDCRDEVGNIARRMLETKELADRELERVQREAPAKTEEDNRVRSYRPPSMRKDFKDLGSPGSRSDANKEAPTPDKVPSLKASSEIEVDEGVEDMDDFMPKLAYKSTRMMR
ncbi:hypothetical protein B0T18DRAFT_318982 [Schizothecium vesticola]|uniref:Uncharacterized protein n=1 Tax=Schizothecium vesticola TaxID=314040 RepID=A0AA40F4A0_9PEZI|nr:hypothetical protein B0T18DRAFT_318982 [Schizothecium vesticola]